MKILIKPYGWMGDTLFATSLAKVVKTKYPTSQVDFFLDFSPMEDLLSLIPHIDNIVTSNDGYDLIFTQPHTDLFKNPLFSQIIDIGFDVKDYGFEEILFEKSIIPPQLTYQSDWQNRTRLNVNYIINELSKYIKCVPIGKNTSINVGDQKENKNIFNQTINDISNSQLHLGMLGGTNVISSYLGVPTFTTLDHHYYHFLEIHGLTYDQFYQQIQITPSVWCKNKKHTEFHPLIKEDELINTILTKIHI